MSDKVRDFIAPAYLLACVVFGGSAQGVWQNALLQLAGLMVIVSAAAWPSDDVFPRSARPILWMVIAGLLIVAIQSIPLPNSIWAFGVRQRIAHDFGLLGLPLPAQPLSLTPHKSLASVLALIPPLAMFCAIVRLRSCRASWLAISLLTGTVAAVLLGILQVVGPQAAPRWYPYSETNIGAAVGFFANANHMAMLLVISLPFLAALGRAGAEHSLQRAVALFAAVAGIALLILIGIVLNGSIAAFALTPVVLAGSALILLRPSRIARRLITAAAIAMLAGALALLSTSSIGADKVNSDARESVASRAEILRTTSQAIVDYFPFGSGLGSFRQVYRTYERPEDVTSEYVVHAHNDYAELVLELGLPGLVLLLCFLMWWGKTFWAIWGRGEGGAYARAGSIACAALLTHSLVEFPLRTATLSVVFAMSLALMAERRRSQRPQVPDLRPTRHVVIG